MKGDENIEPEKLHPVIKIPIQGIVSWWRRKRIERELKRIKRYHDTVKDHIQGD